MSLRTLAAFGELSEAEARLLDGVSSGEVVEIGGGNLPPEDAGRSREIQATFLRYLLLGGCDELTETNIRIHEKGIQIQGALITGILDLEGCRIECDITLQDCRFEKAPVFRSAQIENLFLNGSELPGLSADRIYSRGSIFFDLASFNGPIMLRGAVLGSDLSLIDSKIHKSGDDGIAFAADGLQLTGTLFLRGAEVEGGVQLFGATLGGNLECDKSTITSNITTIAFNGDSLTINGLVSFDDATVIGELRLCSMKLRGNLTCLSGEFNPNGGDCAFNLGGAKINGTFFLGRGATIGGQLKLTSSQIENICDEVSCWPDAGNLLLDRCRYGAFTGGPVTGVDRIKWLELQFAKSHDSKFHPQPWEQCASILRKMGHKDAAMSVLVAMEKHIRAERRESYRRNQVREILSWAVVIGLVTAFYTGLNYGELSWGLPAAVGFGLAMRYGIWLWVADTWLSMVVAYGHRPRRAFVWLGMFWLLGAGMFTAASTADAIKPNDVRILRSAEWVRCHQDFAQDEAGEDEAGKKGRRYTIGIEASQRDCFEAQPEATSYPGFNAWVYSADTLLPVVALEMQSFWIPDDSNRGIGKWARRFLWLQIIAGWGLSLLAVAGFSGLIKSDR